MRALVITAFAGMARAEPALVCNHRVVPGGQPRPHRRRFLSTSGAKHFVWIHLYSHSSDGTQCRGFGRLFADPGLVQDRGPVALNGDVMNGPPGPYRWRREAPARAATGARAGGRRDSRRRHARGRGGHRRGMDRRTPWFTRKGATCGPAESSKCAVLCTARVSLCSVAFHCATTLQGESLCGEADRPSGHAHVDVGSRRAARCDKLPLTLTVHGPRCRRAAR